MIYLEWYLRQSFKRFWMIIRKAGQIFDGSWQRLGKPFEHGSLFLITETRIFNAYKRFDTLVFLGPIQPISGFPFFGNVEATFSSFATLFFYCQKNHYYISFIKMKKLKFWKYLLQEQFGIQPHKQPRPGGWRLGMSKLLNHPHQFDEIWCNVWFGLNTKKKIYIYNDQTPKLRILFSRILKCLFLLK